MKTKNSFASSELVLNKDLSVYHCNLKADELANTIILVGDPDRVSKVSQYFDSIEIKKQKREIISHTGTLNNKRLTVISTGMGTDNIDIVMNELNALVNIDLEKREIKPEHTSLTFVRLGTSGSLQKDVPVDTIVASYKAIGFDGLMSFYANTEKFYETDFINSFIQETQWNPKKACPYCVESSPQLIKLFSSQPDIILGITAAAIGFYGPQGRILRLALEDPYMNERLKRFHFKEERITNFEMESSAIYGLSHLMGHKALSLNTIIANRFSGTFSQNPYNTIDKMIQIALEKLTE